MSDQPDDWIERLRRAGFLRPTPDRRQRSERRALGFGGRRADDVRRPTSTDASRTPGSLPHPEDERG